MFSSDQSWILATSVQSILYGLYLATLVHSLRWLLYSDDGWKTRRRQNINWWMLAITILIFAFSTLDLGTSLRMALFPDQGSSPEANILGIVNNAIENLTILITDAVLILRCWVLYDKSWRVIGLPVVLFLINIACTILLVYWFAMSVFNPSRNQFKYLSNTALVVFFSCNSAINIYGACAIVYRIWPFARGDRHNSGFVYTACYTFAGSGVLYASTSLLLLISRLINPGNPGLLAWLADAINFSMAGITFNLILIRLYQHGSRQHNLESMSTSKHDLPLVQPRHASTEDWPPAFTPAREKVHTDILAEA